MANALYMPLILVGIYEENYQKNIQTFPQHLKSNMNNAYLECLNYKEYISDFMTMSEF